MDKVLSLISEKIKDSLSRERFHVGLDIGSHTVKSITVRSIKDTREIIDFFVTERTNVEEALKRIGVSSKTKINVSVSGAGTIMRYVILPRLSPEELKQALKFEVPKYIPFPADEINLDSFILSPDLGDNKMLVLLAAAKKDVVSQRMQTLENSGILPASLELDSVALINSFLAFAAVSKEELKNKAYALLNIGASETILNIMENDLPRLSRDIHTAGNHFTKKIMERFSLDAGSAERLKMDCASAQRQEVIVCVDAVLGSLAAEVRSSFDYYDSQSTGSAAKIFLSGGSALFPELKDMLANLLGMEVSYWDPLAHLSIASHIDSAKIKSLSGQLAVAAGLAL